MAIARNLNEDTNQTYVPAIVFFCAIMCSMVMLKFRGFKASFNLLPGKKGSKEKNSDIPVLGAYRSNRDEYYVNNNPSNLPMKISPPMVKPQHVANQGFKPSKSTSDLVNTNNVQQNTRKSTTDIPSASDKKYSKDTKNVDKEQRQLEKQKTTEQKKKEKLTHNVENQRLKRENQTSVPKKEKKKAPKPPQNLQPHAPYSSNTLESSISRSSGPPPYSAELIPNHNDNSSNTSFSKPVDGGSWDLVSQHRQQLNRPLTATSSTTKHKSKVLDLQYNAVNTRTPAEVRDNSEA